MNFAEQLDYALIKNAYKKMKECKKCQENIKTLEHMPIGHAYDLHVKNHNE